MTAEHPSAYIAPGAELGVDVEVGPYSIVHKNVIIEDKVKIGAYCELGISTSLGDGTPLRIGKNSIVRSHSVFYESSSFGDGMTTGHHVTVREHTKAGAGFQIGSQSEIQGHCSVGDYVRLQSNVFIGKKTSIGNFVWLLPYVVLTNDPTPPSNILIGCTIEDFASIAAASTVMPGVVIGHHAFIAAHTCVTKNVQPFMYASGVPARIRGPASSIKLRDGSGLPAYPWINHFNRGYPKSIVEKWQLKKG